MIGREHEGVAPVNGTVQDGNISRNAYFYSEPFSTCITEALCGYSFSLNKEAGGTVANIIL